MNSSQTQFVKEIQTHEGVIHKVAFLYADTIEERKDLKQEILSAAWSSYPRFREEAKFSTWLYRIALNVAITNLKKKKRIETDPLSGQVVEATAISDGKELLQIILSKLNAIEKSLVVLLIDGIEQEEIAAILGVTPGNLRVKIHRIREKLRKYGIEGFVE